jgi:hypothetical protein
MPKRGKSLALKQKDIKPGLEVVVIGGGSYYHEKLKITSKPYLRKYQVPNPNIQEVREGKDLVWVENYWVKTSEGEQSLVDMGVCAGQDGRMSLNYTVRLKDYVPEEHP